MSSFESRVYTTPRSARYLVADGNGPAGHVLVGLHGYTQTADRFSEFLEPAFNHFGSIVLPEALSRFYRDHLNGRVGASWMTSDFREYEILDYVAYLDGLYEDEIAGDDVVLTVLGFSQGCPTATRWLGNGVAAAHRLILWGAGPAHDLSDDEWEALRGIPDITLVGGTEDDIVPPAGMDEAEELLARHGCDADRISFDGGHDIPPDVLSSVLA